MRGVYLAALVAVAYAGVVIMVSPAPAPESVKATGWLLIEGSPIAVEPGHRYRGCVRVSFPLSALISCAKIKERAIAEGFADIVCETSHPSGWPSTDCDYYVEATWTKPTRRLDRPGQLPLAWRQV